MEAECLFCPRSMKTCPACGCKICSKHAASANGCCIKCVRAVQEAALAGRCTTAEEDAELEGIGGPDAALYGELTPIGFRTLASRLGLRESDVFVDLGISQPSDERRPVVGEAHGEALAHLSAQLAVRRFSVT